MTNWLSLPPEIRYSILDRLSWLGAGVGVYAFVSEEWRQVLQKRNFSHLKLHPSCLLFLDQLSEEASAQIDYIWLNIELTAYNCRACRKWESLTQSYSNNRITVAAVSRLFSILAKWTHEGRHLTLELNAYSPSDSEHWFKDCYFGAPAEDKFEVLAKRRDFHDPGARAPFGPIQYEPWQLSEGVSQLPWDSSYEDMIIKIPHSVKMVTVFEDFNENYLDLFQLGRGSDVQYNPERVRQPSPGVGAAFASSRELEHLSVAFLVDARHFIDACGLRRWDKLKSLTLTSRTMCKDEPDRTNDLLTVAVHAAQRMPNLETMILWNGSKGEACSFTYFQRDGYASITWRATWESALSPILEGWSGVDRVERYLLTDEIRSHGEAIKCLGLDHVVDNISLQQIIAENSQS
ncbi:hypothetical protein FSST1_005012 [Fusarium sambucinum]